MINVVYHCYLVGNWKEIVSDQLKRLKSSLLYDECDNIYVTVNLSNNCEKEFNELVKSYTKLQIEYFNDNNAEYPAILKVRELGLLYDCKIFYFHTKGVSNTYVRYNDNNQSSEKITNIMYWKECLEYFLIDKWKESVELLNDNDNVGVTCNNGWYWGNFWWTQSSHIKKTTEVTLGSRWSYEAWLNEQVSNTKNYEWYKFTYNPYLTKLLPEMYKNKDRFVGEKINLITAEYGTPSFEIDEGYSGSILNIRKDVTNIIKQYLSNENHERFYFNINNDTMGGDPIHMVRKFLFVRFTPESYPNIVFEMGVHEGSTFDFKF